MQYLGWNPGTEKGYQVEPKEILLKYRLQLK